MSNPSTLHPPPSTVPLPDRLLALQRGSLLLIAPGLYRVAEGIDPASIPDILLARTHRAADGAIRLVPAGEQWIRVDSETVEALGLKGNWQTLLRLAACGFIEIVRPSPRTSLLNLASWWSHLRRVAEDPDFWDEGTPAGRERMDLYREAVRTIHRDEASRHGRRRRTGDRQVARPRKAL